MCECGSTDRQGGVGSLVRLDSPFFFSLLSLIFPSYAAAGPWLLLRHGAELVSGPEQPAAAAFLREHR